MGKTSISGLIKELVNSKHNPLDNDFNVEAFIQDFKEEYAKAEIDLDIKSSENNATELIDAIQTINLIYEQIMHSIEIALDDIDLSINDLIDYILTIANFEYLAMTHERTKVLSSDTDTAPIKIDTADKFKLRNIFGKELDISDAVDITVDTMNEIIHLGYFYLQKVGKRKKTARQEQDSIIRIRNIIYLTNLLVNLRGAFQFYQYEFSELEYKDSVLKFKNSPEIYYLLRLTGKQREQNHIQESLFYLFNQKNIYPEIGNSVSNGVLHIEFRKSKDSIIAKHETAIMIKYYFHLLNKKLKSIGGVTIKEVIEFFIGFKLCFSEINEEETIDKTAGTQSYKFVPRKIEKASLKKAIQKTSGLDAKIVNLLLGQISQYISSNISLWKTPLLQFGNWYYFAIAPIINGHTNYIIDRLLNKSLSISEQEKLFADEIRTELPHRINSNYYFNLIEKLPDLDIPDNILLFEMKDILLIIRVFIFQYPNESEEYQEAISLGAIASETLNSFMESLPESTKKTIVSSLVTNYPTLSGINIAGNMVVDYTLLKNYLDAGKYARGIVITGNGRIDTEELASIKYFNNEDEFNNNLQKFLYDPNPIREIVNKYEHEEHSVFPEHIPYKVYRDGAKAINLESEIARAIKDLEFSINQLFYFEDHYETRNAEEKKFYQEQINFNLSLALNYVALDTSNKNNRLQLQDIISRIKISGFEYLVVIINNTLSDLVTKGVEDLECITLENIDFEKAKEHLDFILDNYLKNQKEVSLSEIIITHNLEDVEVVNLKKYLLVLMSEFNYKFYSDDDLQSFLTILAVFFGLGYDKRFEEHLYVCALNFIDALNTNYHFQKARNFAEEILLITFQRQEIPLLGWLCQFKCFIKQDNPINAAYYGALYVNALKAMPVIAKFQLVDLLFNAMLFFRDTGIIDVVNSIYDAVKTLRLSIYDEQKFTISYFQSKLFTVLSEDSEKQQHFFLNSLSYIEENEKEIKKFGQQGVIPWLGFLYNLKRVNVAFETPLDVDVIEKYIVSFEKGLDSQTLSNVQAMFFPIPEQTKRIFKEALTKILETYNYEDFASEIGKVRVLAENVLLLSLKPLDINNIFLSGIVINDSSLSFEGRKHQDKGPFIPTNNNEIDLDNYASNILEKITLHKGQVIYWVFRLKSNVYALVIKEDKSHELILFSTFDYEIIKKWAKKVDDFSFDAKQGWYSINEQEQDYIKLMQELRTLIFEVTPNTQELLLITDLQLSIFPHNLFQIRSTAWTMDGHEEVVRTEVEKGGHDFLGYHLPVTNIVSFEWYAKNNEIIIIAKSNFTINSWIPTYDEDPALGIGYEKLRPLIEDKYNGQISTDRVPKRSISSINVLLAHGGIGKEGFKTIYTKQSEGHAYIRETGIKHIVGEGIIAVLFVCSSAYISLEFYSQKLESFTNEILGIGYKVVVAPAWKLNPDMTPIWLEEFISSLNTGKSVAFAVYDANIKVAKTGYNDYHGFYAPSGWAAMHVYGNPNIYLD